MFQLNEISGCDALKILALIVSGQNMNQFRSSPKIHGSGKNVSLEEQMSSISIILSFVV